MNKNEVYQLINGKQHGGSPRGVSFWEEAARCGRKANLNLRYAEALAKQQAKEQADTEDGPNALSVGSHYHLLHEYGLRGVLGDVAWDATDVTTDDNFVEAVRLYRAYSQHWGDPLQKWGARLVGPEVPIPSGPAGRNAINHILGAEKRDEDDLTGRIDILVEIDDVSVAYENTGLLLPEPGRYIIDLKTGGQKSNKDEWIFTFGNQTINYLYLYNLDHPEAPAKGWIADKIIRHANILKEPTYTKTGKIKANGSYYHFLAQSLPGDEDVIKNLVQIGAHNLRNDLANPAHCFDSFKACYWFRSGICGRK